MLVRPLVAEWPPAGPTQVQQVRHRGGSDLEVVRGDDGLEAEQPLPGDRDGLGRLVDGTLPLGEDEDVCPVGSEVGRLRAGAFRRDDDGEPGEAQAGLESDKGSHAGQSSRRPRHECQLDETRRLACRTGSGRAPTIGDATGSYGLFPDRAWSGMNSTFDPLVGQVLDDRYEIVAKVARGGMATVYRARDLRLSRAVAVKVMRSDLGEDDEFAAKFDREARSAAVLSHPNVVSVFDQGSSTGQPYIVMEFIEGETLRRVISREAPLPPDRALELFEQICAALAAAHEANVIHRDIKPENVMLTARGQVKVADFGLARQVGSPQMTATGVLVGTASYLPPELVTHSRPDGRSDVYSAGVVLFELLTGKKPHTGENNYQIAYRHVNVDIEKPSERLAEIGHNAEWGIPDYLDTLVLAATARDPRARIADGRELLRATRRARHELARSGGNDNPTLAAALLPDSPWTSRPNVSGLGQLTGRVPPQAARPKPRRPTGSRAGGRPRASRLP